MGSAVQWLEKQFLPLVGGAVASWLVSSFAIPEQEAYAAQFDSIVRVSKMNLRFIDELFRV